MARWLKVTVVIFGSILLCLPLAFSHAQQRTKQSKRVAPPKFDQRRVDSVFFPNVFKEVRGPRPSRVSGGGGTAVANTNSNSGNGSGSSAPAAAGTWSKTVSSDTIESEVKAIKTELDKLVMRRPEFMSRGYLKARTHFTTLSTMFAIINEYDGDIRWKKHAPRARDLFSQVAASCKAGSSQTHKQAKERRDQLLDLLGGSGIDGKADAKTDWGKIVDRSPIMQRLEVAQREILEPAIASKEEFKKQADKVRHEAEIAAVLAAILKKDGMDDAGDEGYDGYATAIEAAAGEIVKGVKQDNYDSVRAAVGKIGAACSACHDDYKG